MAKWARSETSVWHARWRSSAFILPILARACLWQDLLRWVKRYLSEEDIAVIDAGVKLAEVQAAGIERYVLRLPTNFTARSNQPATYRGKGRIPIYGEKIRPLARCYKDKLIPARQPDRVETWTENGSTLRAEIWEDVILPGVVPGKDAKTFRVYAIHDPAYTTPWLLATPLPFKAASVKAIYPDRCSVEQIPLAAKQMVGAHRQFVHADESIQRLPELALLAGSILSFLAATSPWHPPDSGTANQCIRLVASTACSRASHFHKVTRCQGKLAKRHL